MSSGANKQQNYILFEPAVLAMQVDTNIARLFDHRIRHVQEVDGPEHNNDY